MKRYQNTSDSLDIMKFKTLKGHYVVFKEDIQTQKSNIYNINEVLTEKYVYFP